jgi:DNA polymerase (family 10)
MPVENAEVARLFRETADLLDLSGANAFRVRAYRNAARTVEELPQPVEELVRGNGKRLTDLPGIGDDLAGKIAEIVRTGALQSLQELERATPRGLATLMRVRGVGPRRARQLYDELGVCTIAQLERACRARKVRRIPRFGAKMEVNLLRELSAGSTDQGRVLRSVAAQYGEVLLQHLRTVPGVQRAEVAGSYRRRKDTVGDLDILVTGRKGSRVVPAFVGYGEVEEVLAEGPTRASVRLRSGLQVDLRVLNEQSFGAGLYYFTGSKTHNIAVRKRAQQRGLRLNEYGVWRGPRRVAGRTEEEVFAAVGLPWIPPELREDRGEIEIAAAGRLPKLVELDQIRGDLQAHTTDSDGRDSLAEMARAAEELGYEYLAITDHTQAVRVTRGLDREGFRRQMKRIDRLNVSLRKLTVLRGAEVDIHPDGSLDLDDAALAALDLVVVSIHSAFDLSERDQTRRIVRALQHPAVDVLGHPTSRLIGRRGGLRLDLEQVAHAAASEGVLLEVNAQPDRLDLDDVAVRSALDAGATLVISTDAHAVAELGFMQWGVDQARRGWAEPKDVANTRPLTQLLKLLHRGRRAA